MAYSLLHNSRLVYYSQTTQSTPNENHMRMLLIKDAEQMARGGLALLGNAQCFKNEDKDFIYSVIDRNFDSREDMVNTIKEFIRSSAPFMKLLADHAASPMVNARSDSTRNRLWRQDTVWNHLEGRPSLQSLQVSGRNKKVGPPHVKKGRRRSSLFGRRREETERTAARMAEEVARAYAK